LRVRAPLSLPFLVALALCMPLALSGVVKLLWGARDLFDVMSSRIGGPESLVLGAAPVWVPALLFLVVALWPAPAAIDITACKPCRRTQRRSHFWWRALMVATFVVWTLALCLWTSGPRLQSPVAGAVFAPFALVWAALERRSARGPLRAIVRGDVVHWSGDGGAARALTQRAGASQLAPRPGPGELAAWALPAIAAGALIIIAPLAPLAEPCTWGAYPLQYRSGDARVWGCKLPNGRRHGAWHGEHGAWSSSSGIGYDADFWLGMWHGDAELRTGGADGLVARGAYRFDVQVGEWKVSTLRGEVIDVINQSTRELVRSSWLSCPPGSKPSIEGQAHDGERTCVDASHRHVGPYYVVRDLRVVERGEVVDEVRRPTGPR
jgi:hypothetical protein